MENIISDILFAKIKEVFRKSLTDLNFKL